MSGTPTGNRKALNQDKLCPRLGDNPLWSPQWGQVTEAEHSVSPAAGCKGACGEPNTGQAPAPHSHTKPFCGAKGAFLTISLPHTSLHRADGRAALLFLFLPCPGGRARTAQS